MTIGKKRSYKMDSPDGKRAAALDAAHAGSLAKHESSCPGYYVVPVIDAAGGVGETCSECGRLLHRHRGDGLSGRGPAANWSES